MRYTAFNINENVVPTGDGGLGDCVYTWYADRAAINYIEYADALGHVHDWTFRLMPIQHDGILGHLQTRVTRALPDLFGRFQTQVRQQVAALRAHGVEPGTEGRVFGFRLKDGRDFVTSTDDLGRAGPAGRTFSLIGTGVGIGNPASADEPRLMILHGYLVVYPPDSDQDPLAIIRPAFDVLEFKTTLPQPRHRTVPSTSTLFLDLRRVLRGGRYAEAGTGVLTLTQSNDDDGLQATLHLHAAVPGAPPRDANRLVGLRNPFRRARDRARGADFWDGLTDADGWGGYADAVYAVARAMAQDAGGRRAEEVRMALADLPRWEAQVSQRHPQVPALTGDLVALRRLLIALLARLAERLTRGIPIDDVRPYLDLESVLRDTLTLPITPALAEGALRRLEAMPLYKRRRYGSVLNFVSAHSRPKDLAALNRAAAEAFFDPAYDTRLRNPARDALEVTHFFTVPVATAASVPLSKLLDQWRLTALTLAAHVRNQHLTHVLDSTATRQRHAEMAEHLVDYASSMIAAINALYQRKPFVKESQKSAKEARAHLAAFGELLGKPAQA